MHAARPSSSFVACWHGGVRHDSQLLSGRRAAVARGRLEGWGRTVWTGTARYRTTSFLECVPHDHIRFFEGLRLYHQSADCVCTHGGLDPRVLRMHEQTDQALIWGAGTFPEGYQGTEIVVYGHHNNAALNADGWPMPAVLGQTIGIDTISHGVLTAIRLPDRRVFQSARYARRVTRMTTAHARDRFMTIEPPDRGPPKGVQAQWEPRVSRSAPPRDAIGPAWIRLEH